MKQFLCNQSEDNQILIGLYKRLWEQSRSEASLSVGREFSSCFINTITTWLQPLVLQFLSLTRLKLYCQSVRLIWDFFIAYWRFIIWKVFQPPPTHNLSDEGWRLFSISTALADDSKIPDRKSEMSKCPNNSEFHETDRFNATPRFSRSWNFWFSQSIKKNFSKELI